MIIPLPESHKDRIILKTQMWNNASSCVFIIMRRSVDSSIHQKLLNQIITVVSKVIHRLEIRALSRWDGQNICR